MPKLLVSGDKFVKIQGVPYQKGTLQVERNDYANSLLTVFVIGDPHAPLISKVPYADLTLDGVPAANWAAVEIFAEDNFFFEPGVGGGTATGTAYIKTHVIAEESQFIHADMGLITVEAIGVEENDGSIGINWYRGSQIVQDKPGNRISFVNIGFLTTGDSVLIMGNYD